MASRLRKERVHEGVRQALNNRDDQNTTLLVDEGDTFNPTSTSLSLRITGNDLEDKVNVASPTSAMHLLSFDGNSSSTPGLVTFEVVSAEKVKEGRHNFVLYHIAVLKHGETERTSETVEKRYSDFEKLHLKLKRRYPDLMEEVSFPGKVIVGNFSDETIAKRSRAFEQYLTHLFSIDSIRFSEEVKIFFFDADMQKGFERFECEDYKEAVMRFEKSLPIQEKLLGDTHPDVLQTLSALVVSYQKMGKVAIALKFCESTLSCIGDDIDNLVYLPMLQMAVYLHWLIGKEKGHLERKLTQMKSKGYKTDITVDLRALVLHYYKSESVWYCDTSE